MSLTKKQKNLIKRVEKYFNFIISNEIQLIELLYSPFNPVKQKYISNKKDEKTILAILDFIQYGRSKWNDFQTKNK